MPTAPAALSPAAVEPLHAPDESTLAALLDLFDHDHDHDRDHDRDKDLDEDLDRTRAHDLDLVHDQAPGRGGDLVRRAPGRSAARRTWRVARAWAVELRSRAAAWGTGPEGVHRAW